MNILVLTNVLPAPILTKHIRENDILIKTADIHENMHKDVKYIFVYVKANILFTNIFPKDKELKERKEHQEFVNLKKYSYKGRVIEIISVPTYKWNEKFRSLYLGIAYLINKKKLKRIIKDHNIDLIHAHNIISDIGIAYQLYKDLKIPYIVTTRRMGKVYLDSHIRKFILNAKAVISLGYQEKRMSDPLNVNSYLVPHGVDNQFLLQKKHYSKSSILKIVTFSRLLSWKNIDKTIRALEQIKEGFTYDIYGDGPEFEKLQGILNGLSIKDKVNFKGFIPYDLVAETMVNYDLFVLPSYKEWFGRVYIEAMACGLPVIGSRGTGMDGYITEGVHGFLVNHKNIEEITKTIRNFISDDELKISMGQNAKILSQNFTWKSVISKLDNIYRATVSASKE